MPTWTTSLSSAARRGWRGTRGVRRLTQEIVVALSLAVLVWLYTRSRARDTLDQVSIPVQIQLASAYLDQYDLEINGSSRVVASFTGPSSRVRELRRQVQLGQVQVAFTLNVPEERQNDSIYRGVVRV